MPALPGSGTPPAIINVSNTCTANGSEIAFSCNKGIAGVGCSIELVDFFTGNPVWSGSVPSHLNSQAFTISGTADGNYTLTADNGEATASVPVEVSCGAGGGGLVLTLGTVTPATSTSVADGAVAYTLSGAAVPITVELKQNAVTVQTDTQPVGSYSFANVAAGSYDLLAYTAAGVVAPLVGVVVGTNPVLGCTNPDADNFDPGDNVTSEPALCNFSPKLALTAPPALGALGRPLWVALQSAAVMWSTPSKATATLTLVSLVAGVTVTVNGYRFTVGPPLTPDRFEDADTLAVALRGVPALSAAYVVTTTATTVVLTARQFGPAGNIRATSSNPGRLLTQATAGQPTTHSERRIGWGCWLEVWALPALDFGGTSKAAPELAYRFESRFREDNNYQFDISDALRAFTGLSFDCSDRVIGYFLRYGETYAEAAGGYRRVRPAVGESPVLFGLEAVEVVGADQAGERLLSTRPGPFRLADGGHVFAAVLPAAGPVVLSERIGGSEPTQTADAVAVHFVPGQGGRETAYFEGLEEPLTKRTASFYATPTGRAMQQASLPPAFRLNSGLLPRAEWDWLRQELGNSPAVWVEMPTGPQPVVVTALTADADEMKNEYSVLIEYELCDQQARGLTN